MAGSEHAPDLLSGLPTWVQVAANLGMFCVAVIAAAFGFVRRLAGKGFIGDNHFEEGGRLFTTGEDFREMAAALTRTANAIEGLLDLFIKQDRETTIEKEIARRVRERRQRQRND